MWKGALVGAVALTVGMVPLAKAQSDNLRPTSYEALAPAMPRMTEAHIVRLKTILNLTQDQLAHWPPVEAALRALAKEQRQSGAATLIDDMGGRAATMASTLHKLRKLAVAAAPLIRSLDGTQKRDAMALIRQLGFERLVAAF